MAISNNAVAGLQRAEGYWLYSFFGLGTGKTYADISTQAFALKLGDTQWQRLPSPPVAQGRLASVAAAVGESIYLFGGYTVAADGHEVSTPEVWRFDTAQRRYTAMAPMPTPVDDSVALVWRGRWIVLVSGWHDDRNVPLVQLYDTADDRWSEGTAWPGTPVFGHAGAIVGDSAVICDGVRLDVSAGQRQFSASAACWRGELSSQQPGDIRWRQVPSHPGAPRYRMGAAAGADGNLYFAGGSERPYNFNGVGYDGLPAAASDVVQRYDLARDVWQTVTPLAIASMDHRGLVAVGHDLVLVGGMRDPQRVSAQLQRLSR